MTRLVRAEVLKLRTVRTLLWAVVALVVLVGIAAVSVAASTGEIVTSGHDRGVARISAISIVFALLVGITVIGAEGTHGTITQTFLVSPLRERVLAAKICVAGAVGLLLAVLAEALTLAIAVPGAGLHVHNVRLVLAGVLIGAALAGALGVGLGALLHTQGAAIAVALIWLLIVENILVVALHDNVKYLPVHAFAAVVGGTRGSEQSGLLGEWPAAVACALYAAGFLAAGTALLSRRDV